MRAVTESSALVTKSCDSQKASATEDTFNDAFWESQDFVTNALDSVKVCYYIFQSIFSLCSVYVQCKIFAKLTFSLDSVKARGYVDGRCVFYGKPLFESGTEGTKFNSMVILPHLTQTYTDGPEDTGTGNAIPMCTLRNFPSTIIHCIEWAKAQFVDMFEAEVDDLSKYVCYVCTGSGVLGSGVTET